MVRRDPRYRSPTRLAMMGALVVAVGVPVGLAVSWPLAPAAGWTAASGLFVVTTWLRVARLDPAETRAHASREDPGRATADLLILAASVASLGAVAVLLASGSRTHGAAADVLAAFAVVSVAVSWTLVHTVYTLRYARAYYSEPVGGIDFNSDVPPRYVDFAYVSFDLGMTYQISDTTLTTSALRGVVLGHTLLSYLFGSVVLASIVNLVSGLG